MEGTGGDPYFAEGEASKEGGNGVIHARGDGVWEDQCGRGFGRDPAEVGCDL